MAAIVVDRLSKVYTVPERESGLLNALRALLHRRYRDIPAVSEVSFQIAEGEIVGFLGPNGAGKTTTLKMLSGLLYPSSGTATVLGHTPWERRSEFQRAITLVMGQRSQLWWEIPAQETFRLNKEIYGLGEEEFRRSMEELTELLELQECLSVPVKKLSLGQRMKTELAVSLLHRPKVLLLDEPTLGLDVVMQKKVRQFILHYAQTAKATVLLTSHNMGDIMELCPRVVVIDRGRILHDGALRSVVERFAPHKLIRADFQRPVSARELESVGRVLESAEYSAVIEVPREEVSKRAADLLGRFAVLDLTIEDTPAEEVIRRLFQEKHKGSSQ
ncbi:MAG: ATP-binding cassette domain-containing protein [Elusimicrobiota bacterium]